MKLAWKKKRMVLSLSSSRTLSMLAVLFFVTYIGLYWSTTWFSQEKWFRFVQTLFSLGVIFTVISIAVEAGEKEEENQRARLLMMNQNTELYYTDILLKFAEYDPYSFPLYREMNPQNPTLGSLSIDHPRGSSTKEPDKVWRISTYLANVIFQRIENMLQYFLGLSQTKNTREDLASWESTWVQWFSSPTLREIWKYDKVYYMKTTQDYVDQLILSKS